MSGTDTSHDSGIAVRLTSVDKSFGGVQILQDISIDFHVGEVHALVGENGAGKSSVGKIIGGFYSPERGRAELFGQPVSRFTPRDALSCGVAMIHQELQLVPELTVLQNVFLGLESNHAGILSRGDLKRFEALEATCKFELDPHAKVSGLRIAQRQKVEIMRAIARDARMIVMDEPTSSLTRDEVDRLHDLIRRLRDDGRSVIYVSHFLSHIIDVCDRVTVMRDGRVIKTVPIAGETEDSLVAAMLGRKMDVMWPELPPPPDPSVAPLLSVRNLSTATGLSDVSIDIRRGEIVSLIGLVGSGRTELARAVFGADPALSGEVVLDGKPLKTGSIQAATEAGIAMVPEDRRGQGLILTQTTRPNMSLSVLSRLSRTGVLNRAKERALVRSYIEHFEIVPAGIDGNVRRYSGGNQQKVLLAKWAATEPRILILDEPSRGVDVGARQRIHELIIELARSGSAILLISSEIEEAINLSHRGYLLNDGQILAPVNSRGLTVDDALTRIFKAQTAAKTSGEN